MPRASLASLVAALAVPQSLVSAGDDDDAGYFSIFPSGPILPDLPSLPGSGANSDDAKSAKEEPQKPIVAPNDAYAFGPKNCVKTWLNVNRCMMQTDCEEADIKDYMFHLICVDRGGEKAKHTFGVGSFEPKETFDTLITCKICTGEKVIDTQLTAKQVDPNPKANPAKVVQDLVGAVRDIQSEMKDAAVAIERLKVQVFPGEGAQVPPAAEAEPPVKFAAEALQPRDEGRLPEMTRFLAHRKSVEALKAAAEAGRENMAMHRAAMGLDGELHGLHDWSRSHSKLQRIKRETTERQRERAAQEAERKAVMKESERLERVTAKRERHDLVGRAQSVARAHEHGKRHEHVQVQDEQLTDQSASDSQDQSDAATQDNVKEESEQGADAQDQSDAATQDNVKEESEQGADAQDGEGTVDDASQESAAGEGDDQQQDSGVETQEADATQDEGSTQEEDSSTDAGDTDASQNTGPTQENDTLNMHQQSGAEAQDADASQDEGSNEAQGQEDEAQEQSEGGEEEGHTQEADPQVQEESPNHGEFEALVQAPPKALHSKHRAMLLQQQTDSTRVSTEAATTEAPEPVAEYDMSDPFQAEQLHKDDLALN